MKIHAKKLLSAAIIFAILTNIFAIKTSANTHLITLRRGELSVGGTATITATVGQLLPATIIPPTSVVAEGVGTRIFAGYYDTANPINLGTRYYNPNGERVFNEPWNGTSNIILYAHWALQDDVVLYHENGTGDFQYVTRTHVDERVINNVSILTILTIPLPIPPTEFHVFAGYFTGRNGQGTQYYAANGERAFTGTSGLRMAYAHYVLARFPLIFEKNGGQGGTENMILTRSVSNLNANVGSATLPTSIEPPTRQGYTFTGYYFALNGTSVTAFNGNGSRAYSAPISSNDPFTIHALWRCDICENMEDNCACVYCDDCDVLIYDGKIEYECLCEFCEICHTNIYLHDCICVYCNDCNSLIYDGKSHYECLCEFCGICQINLYLHVCICEYCKDCGVLIYDGKFRYDCLCEFCEKCQINLHLNDCICPPEGTSSPPENTTSEPPENSSSVPPESSTNEPPENSSSEPSGSSTSEPPESSSEPPGSSSSPPDVDVIILKNYDRNLHRQRKNPTQSRKKRKN